MLRKKAHNVRYAIKGLKIAWREEISFRIQIAIAIAVVALGILFGLHAWEWAVIFFLFGFVLSAEAFNTALEEFCDMVKGDPDPHIAKIKDLAAAAVLIASLTSVVVGLFIFWPHIF